MGSSVYIIIPVNSVNSDLEACLKALFTSPLDACQDGATLKIQYMKTECQILMLEQIAYHIFERDY